MKHVYALRAILAGLALFTTGTLLAAEASGIRPTTINPLDVSSVPSNLSAFNPALGLVLDTAFQSTRNERSDFRFRSAELNMTAAVDPFANLYAIINGTPDEIEVEEAAFVTTSLPWNLTVRGGRFFVNFGRLPHWHDHELPFVNRTASLENFVGGEGQAEGAEVIHLFKTPFFLQGTLGAYKKIGAENTRLKQTVPSEADGHSKGRGAEAMTYLQRLFTYIPLGDISGVDVGISNALTPRQFYIGGVRNDALATPRWLNAFDLTFRYEPTGAHQVGKFLWGTEVFRNDERRRQESALDTDGDGAGDTDTFERKQALGGYSYVDWRFAPRWSTGGFVDIANDLNNRRQTTHTYGITLNFLPSEFQRIRLQVSKVKINDGTKADHQVFLQWFGSIGTHVHLFKDR